MLLRLAIVVATTLIGLEFGEVAGWLLGEVDRNRVDEPRDVAAAWHVGGAILGFGLGAYLAFARSGRLLGTEPAASPDRQADSA